MQLLSLPSVPHEHIYDPHTQRCHFCKVLGDKEIRKECQRWRREDWLVRRTLPQFVFMLRGMEKLMVRLEEKR